VDDFGRTISTVAGNYEMADDIFAPQFIPLARGRNMLISNASSAEGSFIQQGVPPMLGSLILIDQYRGNKVQFLPVYLWKGQLAVKVSGLTQFNLKNLNLLSF